MERIENITMDAERALYGSDGLEVLNCRFDGPADGESALKECRNVRTADCFFNLRYPFWHNRGLTMENCELTDRCRAALWYSEGVKILNTKLHGIKALRECRDVTVSGCSILSPEFGWSTTGITMENTTAESEYFMMRSSVLSFRNVNFRGKYSFQYNENGVFENCVFDTKDAFWHGKHLFVRNCTVKGEYLAWYSEDLTFENCRIIGTQPFCYCRGLKVISCEMVDTDLAFEKSDVVATLTAPIVSIKNPLSGLISAPAVGEIIRDDPQSAGQILTGGTLL